MKKLTLVLLVTCLLSVVNLDAVIVMNDIVRYFEDTSERVSIENDVIEGAIHFLKSKSYSDLILMEYEKSAKQAIDYPVILDYTDKAITELEKAKENYIRARDTGVRIGADKSRADSFKTFNYGQLVRTKKFNTVIANRVTAHFSKGDVVGAHNRNLQNIEEILQNMYFIREQLKNHITPGIDIFWKMLQQYSEAALFGNYCTVIGSTVLKAH